MLMVAFLGMAALAIDVGSFYKAQRQAQSAADAGALAAVHDLPGSQTAATSDVNRYVAMNYPDATATETYPSSTQVKVVVSATTPSFFGRIFGLTSANVSASATAGYAAGSSSSAVFAMDSTCSGLGVNIDTNSTGDVIHGGISSNGSLTVNGKNASVGATTYGGPNGCSASYAGKNATFTSGPTATSTLSPWPLDYSSVALKPPCDFSAPSYTFSTSNPTPGVYCATGAITITADVTLTGVTLVANSFVLGGKNVTMTPASDANGLSLYETGSGLLSLDGEAYTLGTVFAPNAEIEVARKNAVISGFLEGYDVYLLGKSVVVTGTGPPSSDSVSALQG